MSPDTPRTLGPLPDVRLPEGYVRPVAIGSGGQATVWRASALRGPSPVAIKAFRRGDAHAFYTELRVALELDSPHLPTFHGIEDGPDGRRYLIEEYCGGGDLRTFIQQNLRLNLLETARVATHVLRALKTLHAVDMIHADVKPANILARTRRSPRMWVLTDFGVSSRTHDTRGRRGFTPAYAAPEQKTGAALPASDIHCLATTLLECLNGSLHRRDPLGGLAPDLSSWFRGALSHDPRDRPTAAESLEFWQDVFADASIQEYATPPAPGPANDLVEAC